MEEETDASVDQEAVRDSFKKWVVRLSEGNIVDCYTEDQK